MDKLEIELSNCFGIDSLRHIFEFEKGRVFLYMQETVL